MISIPLNVYNMSCHFHLFQHKVSGLFLASRGVCVCVCAMCMCIQQGTPYETP